MSFALNHIRTPTVLRYRSPSVNEILINLLPSHDCQLIVPDALRTQLNTLSPERGRIRAVAVNGSHRVPPNARLQRGEYGLIQPGEDVL